MTTTTNVAINGNTAELEVSSRVMKGRNCLFLNLKGFITEETIRLAYAELKSEKIKNHQYTVVVDCTEVTNYDCDSRNLLQDILIESKENIESLWVITNSMIIHAAIEIMSFFTATDIKVVANVSQLDRRLMASS